MKVNYLLSIMILGLFSVISSATIINIPADYSTIQAGVDASSDGDTVLVHPGTYVENIVIDDHNITLASLFLTTGDTSFISQTVIDGDSSGTVVDYPVNLLGSNYLFGITITNGYSVGKDGGIFCNHSNLTISNCNIVNNRCFYYHGNYFAGGIGCYEGYLKVENCLIANNEGRIGAIRYSGVLGTEIKRNTIIDNYAYRYGGGLGIISHNYTAIIDSNVIANNVAEQYGGGIYSSYSIVISNNVIDSNVVNSVIGGAGIGCASDSIYNNIITNNSSNSSGGGIWIGGNAIIQNNIMAYNTAPVGAGLYSAGNSAFIDGNTIIQNTAFNYGGALECEGIHCYSTCKNNIIWGNTPDGVHYSSDPNSIIEYNNIQGGWPGDGNIDCHPLFCNPEELNFYLSDVSCCIGAGEGGVDIGAYGVGCASVQYQPGDVGMYAGQWPPHPGLADVSYLVNYFRGHPLGIPCLIDGYFASADVNGDCSVIGSDVTYLVNYFRGINPREYCPDYPPAWYYDVDAPSEMPSGWPNCE